ncbi:MAG: LPS assembly lipoprotein LptE [Planctomycetota bacterium]
MNARALTRLTPPLALLLSACGYTFGTGLDQRSVRTVGLMVVGNETYRQRLEVELGAALARELPVSTDLRYADRRSADAVLKVVLTDARERTLVSGSRTNAGSDPVREGTLEAAIRMQLVGRDGKILLERQLLDRTEFRSPIGEDLTTARAELVEDLARKIALALESDF